MNPNPAAERHLAQRTGALPTSRARYRLVEAMLDAALSAYRAGTLDELLRQRPLAGRWLMRRHGSLVGDAVGDSSDRAAALPAASAVVFLRWLVTQLRPDLSPTLSHIEREAWLNLTSWRPMLAVMCHAGLAEVPEFRDRYRRRNGEPAIDNLCGLWGVGVSTFYRYLERGKRAMAQIVLESPPSAASCLSLRQVCLADAMARLQLDAAGLAQWHQLRATQAIARRDAASALWHSLQAGDAEAFLSTLTTHAAALAGEPETDALVERLAATPLGPRQRFDLWMARATLARTRNAAEREHQAYEHALQIANTMGDRMLLGIVYGALGKFFEPRDGDRAFACYEDSAEFLGTSASNDEAAARHFLTTLVRLAWLYALRNDPRSRSVLDRVDVLRAEFTIADDLLGMVEQTWGEYWWRAGDLRKALEHKHRALNIFERVGDNRSILATFLNLSWVYTETKEFDRAIGYARRIMDASDRQIVEPAIVASAHVNLGAAYFFQGRYDQAIEHYQFALERSLQANLRLQANRAHHNLAEAFYKRFQAASDPEDERRGDLHAATSMNAPLVETTHALVEASRGLKAEVLGDGSGAGAANRLLPEESAVHFEEMAEIQRHRAVLAVPLSPEAHVRARLAIANAYLAISVKEREAALQLIQRHALSERFTLELGQLRSTFDRELTREQQLMLDWQNNAGELLEESRRIAVIDHLLREGFISKSGYAQVSRLSPATASKHLATLTERGLLQQSGKGPSTRYRFAN